MKNIQIIGSGMYVPKNEITNSMLEKKLDIEQGFIKKRTGINKRYFVDKEEDIETLAILATMNLINKNNIDVEKIDMIITATTSTNKLMPGISFEIQKYLKLKKCICMDVLAGCSGFINAFDIARNYIAIGRVNRVLIVASEVLSKYSDENDVSTKILLADGAGAILIEKTEENKKYECILKSDGINGKILTCKTDGKIHMDGKEIYKYAVLETTKNILEILEKANESLEDIKYIVLHQSNKKIMNAILNRLKIENNKMYSNIENIGNTFCSSIPIAISEMLDEKKISKGDKIIMTGYGGGLNLGSILIEI